MPCKRSLTNGDLGALHEDHGALLSSTIVYFQYDIGRRSYSMTVRGMYDAEADKSTGLTRMTRHTPCSTAMYFDMNTVRRMTPLYDEYYFGNEGHSFLKMVFRFLN